MIMANSKFSEIIQKVEALISKINDADFKQQLLQDFDMTLNLVTDIGDNYVDNNVIKMLLWIKNNTSLDMVLV